MDWKTCVDDFDAVRASPNIEKAKSLKKIAERRMAFLQKQELNEANSDFILEHFYSAALELLHAILITEGYKIKNHICAGYYIRDILKREDLFAVFDTNRKRRNSLLYYGDEIPFAIAKGGIQELKTLIGELAVLLNKKIKN